MTLNSSFDKKALILTLLLLIVTISIAGVMGVIVISDPAVKYSQSFARAASIVRDVYPDTVDWQSAMLSAREEMFAGLDPFSGYIDKERLDQFVDELSGGYHGIGVSVTGDDDGLLIVTVREGGPAAKEGILAGDIILAVDSIILAGKTASEATRVIKGEEDTKVKTRIFRPATNDTLDFEITRQRIDFLHVPFAGMTPDSFVYIRLLDFDAGATEDLSNAIDSLVIDKQSSVNGMILDLRDNPGGLFEEARKTVDLFTKKNEFIVGSSGRSRWESEEFFAKKNSDLSELPLAIIVNDGSASSSEIVAGALKYSGRAIIVGDTTFGKGLVQGYFRMPDGDGLRLTISRYFFEGGRFINSPDSAAKKRGDGIVPDRYYEYIENNPFYTALQNSFLVFRFAHKFQDGIIEADRNQNARDRWIARFKTFALENEFDFESETTEIAEYLLLQAESRDLKKAASRLAENSHRADNRFFDKYADFIWLRLRQIALERKYGTYRSYREVVMPEYEPIQLAINALKEKD
jgi:carboxyl-terminal processing protease